MFLLDREDFSFCLSFYVTSYRANSSHIFQKCWTLCSRSKRFYADEGAVYYHTQLWIYFIAACCKISALNTPITTIITTERIILSDANGDTIGCTEDLRWS